MSQHWPSGQGFAARGTVTGKRIQKLSRNVTICFSGLFLLHRRPSRAAELRPAPSYRPWRRALQAGTLPAEGPGAPATAAQEGERLLPQFLLPQLPPQAWGLASAVLVGLGGSQFAAAAFPIESGEPAPALQQRAGRSQLGGRRCMPLAGSGLVSVRSRGGHCTRSMAGVPPLLTACLMRDRHAKQACRPLVGPAAPAPGNVNAFLGAVDAAYRVGSTAALAVPFSAAIGAGNSTELAAAVASSVALVGGESELAGVLGDAYGRAVANQIARLAGVVVGGWAGQWTERGRVQCDALL